MRQKMFLVFLAVLLFDVVIVQSINPNIRVNPVGAQPIPNLSVDPPETVDPLLVVGQEFTVSLNISDAEGSSADGLYGWQAKIAFNTAVVNCTSRTKVVEGPFLKDWFPDDTTFQRAINYEAGYVLVACSKKPEYTGGGAIGDGILAYITFIAIANERATLLQFADVGGSGGTYLRTAIGGVLAPIEPFTTQDGVFDNRSGPNTAPVADFSVLPLEATKRGEVIFDASASYDPDAWIISYEWDYGDGTSEIYLRERLTDINLTTTTVHKYTLNGTYPVALTVEDSDGATATTSSQATVLFDIAVTNIESPFIAVIPGTLATINVTVTNYGDFNEAFNLTTYYDSTAIETQEIWGLAPQIQETFTFNWDTTGVDLGQYTLKANASTVEGEVNVDNNEYIDGLLTVGETNIIDYLVVVGGLTSHVIIESNSTISAFSFSRAEKSASFNATGELDTGGFCNVTIPMMLLNASSPDAWIVEFDGSSISYDAISNGTHYLIHFTYTHGDASHTINIVGESVATPPVALFTASKNTALAGESITFDASLSYDPDGTIEIWSWDFGDGVTDAGEVVGHSYAAYGTYVVTLTIEDNEGRTNSTQQTILIIDYPVADFTFSPETPLVDQTITFDATASEPNGGTITTYAWEFGDGQTATGATTTHSYSTTGTYTVNLTVTDSEDLTNSITKIVTVQIHDITITSLTASPTTVKIGEIVTIQLTVQNNGNFTESFTITTYTNNTAIETKTVTDLTSGASQILTILWDTTDFSPAAYIIRAETSTIPEETKTDDNTYIGDTVTVQKKTSALTITASVTTLTLGKTTKITGTLIPVMQGATITVQYRLAGEAWSALETTTTNAQGQYEFTWAPDQPGTYEIQAVWQGDTSTEGSQSNVETITVKEVESQWNWQYIVIALAIIIVIAVAIYFFRFRR